MKAFKRNFYIGFITLFTLIFYMTNISYAANIKEKSGLEYFTKKYDYTEETFKDVSAEWIKKALKPSYELGLIRGRTPSKFDPNGHVTIAEALSIASRIHEIYHGGDGIIENIGSKWYDGPVIYAVDNGLITGGQFSNYEKKATRAELANLFSHALPENELKAINHITELPDVTNSDLYFDSILRLFNAGILSGSDLYGTFYPSQKITRAETAVILTRIIKPNERKILSLKKKSTESKAASQLFQSSDQVFCLSASSVWFENNPYQSDYSNLELNTYDNLCQLAGVTIQKSEVLEKDLLTYNASCIKELSKKLDNASSSPSIGSSVNGKNAVFTNIKGSIDNVKMNYYIMVIENDTQFVLVSTVFPDSIAKEAFDRVTTLLHQFKFQEK